jgi:hypothetical protein
MFLATPKGGSHMAAALEPDLEHEVVQCQMEH